MLYELSKLPAYQARMREEIREARARVISRGDGVFTMDDLDGMKVVLAAIKAFLFLHCCDELWLSIFSCRKPFGSTRLPTTFNVLLRKTTSSLSQTRSLARMEKSLLNCLSRPGSLSCCPFVDTTGVLRYVRSLMVSVLIVI